MVGNVVVVPCVPLPTRWTTTCATAVAIKVTGHCWDQWNEKTGALSTDAKFRVHCTYTIIYQPRCVLLSHVIGSAMLRCCLYLHQWTWTHLGCIA